MLESFAPDSQRVRNVSEIDRRILFQEFDEVGATGILRAFTWAKWEAQ